jgi:hypothetical protein
VRRASAAAVLALAVAIWGGGAARAQRFSGVVPDRGSAPALPAASGQPFELPYEGGSVLHSNRTHLIFWIPAGSGLRFVPGYEALIATFLRAVAAASHMPTNVYGLSGQYRDAAGPAAYASQYGGAVIDTDPLPANGCEEPPGPPAGSGPGWHDCLDDQQLQAEITHVIALDALPVSPEDIYFLITPDGLGSCEYAGPADCALGGNFPGSYCGYHSATPGGLPYAVIPYNAVRGHCQSSNPRPNANPADPALSSLSHEHNEIVTDPYDDAWIDSGFEEEGDLCYRSFGAPLGGSGASAFNELIAGHRYFLQEEWSNDDSSCEPRDEADRLSLRTVPAHPRAGTPITFLARGRDPDGRIVSYDWLFAATRRAHGRRAREAFRRPGRYRVLLRSTDSAGDWSLYARIVRISR